jgi:hypothetical protein
MLLGSRSLGHLVQTPFSLFRSSLALCLLHIRILRLRLTVVFTSEATGKCFS